MTITGQSALSSEEIDRMVRDAEQHAEEDRRRAEEADTRNTAETLLHRTDKLLADEGEKLPAELKARVEEAQRSVRSQLEDGDVEALRTATDGLMAVSQEVGQALYAAGAQEQAGAATGASGTGGSASSDDDIVDAEVVDDEDGR